jgi:hypothetical protein
LVKRSSVITNVLSGRLGYVNPWLSLIGIWPEDEKQRAIKSLTRVGIADKAHDLVDMLRGAGEGPYRLVGRPGHAGGALHDRRGVIDLRFDRLHGIAELTEAAIVATTAAAAAAAAPDRRQMPKRSTAQAAATRKQAAKRGTARSAPTRKKAATRGAA